MGSAKNGGGQHPAPEGRQIGTPPPGMFMTPSLKSCYLRRYEVSVLVPYAYWYYVNIISLVLILVAASMLRLVWYGMGMVVWVWWYWCHTNFD